MQGPRQDVLVVGGGPAGSSAAILLARYGHRVTVIDRARFPRPRIGESLPPKIEGLLGILGVRGAVERAGFARMRGTVVERGDTRLFHEFDPDVGRRGYQVERGRFDALLLDEARAAGAEVREEVSALQLLEADGRLRGASVQDAEGRRDLPASWVLDATGSAAWGGRALGLRRREAVRTVALAGYWRQSRLPQDFEATATLFEMLPQGWIWSLLRQDGLRNVTIGVDAGAVKDRDVVPEALYHSTLAESKLVGPLVREAQLDGPLKAHDATWQHVERFARPGLLHVGDAAAVIDPLTSQGVYKAIQSGIVAAAVVNTALTRPEDEAMALEYYEGSQGRFAANYGELSRSFYRASPFATAPFWAARIRAEAEAPEELGEAEVEARAARREGFRSRVQEQGGLRLLIGAQDGLRVESRPSAEAGLIVRRAAFVIAGESVDTPRVEPVHLGPLLDGRPMARIFDAYADAIGEPPSLGLGRRLMAALSALAERDALRLGSPDDDAPPRGDDDAG